MGTLHQCGWEWWENTSTDHSLTQAVLTCGLPTGLKGPRRMESTSQWQG